MLARDIAGQGEATVVLLHAVGSRHDWDPIHGRLARDHRVVRFDLPNFGDNPRDPDAATPEAMARRIATDLDTLGIERATLAGLSLGGWVALELARLDRADAVLGLGTAGLWRKRSPRLTDLKLNVGWLYAKVYRPLTPFLLRHRLIRRLALRELSARPADVAPEHATHASLDLARATGWRLVFRATRGLRFRGGQTIDVPVVLAFGERDRIAPAGKSRVTDELPAHATVETWEGCGHNLVWDAPDRVVAAVGRLTTRRREAPTRASR